MKTFTTQSMQKIFSWLHAQKSAHISFEVLNPDLVQNAYAGKLFTCKEKEYAYRGYKAWSDLAEILFCKMLTPRIASECTVIISYEKLNLEQTFHKKEPSNKEEKYGTDSEFFKIYKHEEPAFLHPYLQALDAVKIRNKKRILNLGINRGDEFEIILHHIGEEAFLEKEFIGIDYSKSAIESAKKRFDPFHVSLHVKDINTLDELELKRSDLIISIGTLQSPSINFKPFFMHLVQNYLRKDAAIILGFPNSRWIDGEIIYGAKAPNYNYSEQSLLYNDVIFCKKYLQQHKFRVTLTGKQYLFLTATKINL